MSTLIDRKRRPRGGRGVRFWWLARRAEEREERTAREEEMTANDAFAIQMQDLSDYEYAPRELHAR